MIQSMINFETATRHQLMAGLDYVLAEAILMMQSLLAKSKILHGIRDGL